MSEKSVSSPVAFIIFNRPDTTASVFAEIAKARPSKLLVVADGPRPDHADDRLKCMQARSVIENVDWPCEVLTNYSETNMGCKNRVSSGIDWVFEQVPEAIILEDDCLPDSTFFQFCDELLDRYRDDSRIGMISGDNFQLGAERTSASYYFSRFTHIWGWATWRRAWEHYDRDISIWPQFCSDRQLEQIIPDPKEREYWETAFQGVFDGKIDTWDYQWTFACWSQSMMTVIPRMNLVANIGFSAEATHTTSESQFSDMDTGPIAFPLLHPDVIIPNVIADTFTSRIMFRSTEQNVIERLRAVFRR